MIGLLLPPATRNGLLHCLLGKVVWHSTSLVVNTYQTNVHLVPKRDARIIRGSRDVHVVGMDNKRQITTMVSYSISGDLLLLHLELQGPQKTIVFHTFSTG
jgi:hypothetical protein